MSERGSLYREAKVGFDSFPHNNSLNVLYSSNGKAPTRSRRMLVRVQLGDKSGLAPDSKYNMVQGLDTAPIEYGVAVTATIVTACKSLKDCSTYTKNRRFIVLYFKKESVVEPQLEVRIASNKRGTPLLVVLWESSLSVSLQNWLHWCDSSKYLKYRHCFYSWHLMSLNVSVTSDLIWITKPS